MTIMRTKTGLVTSWVLALASLLPVTALAQKPSVDPEAARIMQRMTEYVGSLQTFGLVSASTWRWCW